MATKRGVVVGRATSGSRLTRREAESLDRDVREALTDLGASLALGYLRIAGLLQRMQATGGYKLLGCKTWEAYLRDRVSYARTTAAYLVRLGNSDLAAVQELVSAHGLSGTQLLEFAKAVTVKDGSAIPRLIQATASAVEGKTVRETRSAIQAAVAANQGAFQRPHKARSKRAERDWAASFRQVHDALPEGERERYVEGAREFLHGLESPAAPKPAIPASYVPADPGPQDYELVRWVKTGPSGIEWCDDTWNPARGCDWVSPACDNCYAKALSEGRRGKVKGFLQGFAVTVVPRFLFKPLSRAGSWLWFVDSMTDLFNDDIPDGYIVDVFRVMVVARWHTFQVLTKRPARMERMVRSQLAFAAQADNIWWGVTVEDRKHGLPRLRVLQRMGVYLRFLSVEPLLEDLGEIDLGGIGWVICGGESGTAYRPMEREWAERLFFQCQRAEIPFFLKQWGGPLPRKGGHEWMGRREHREVPMLRRYPKPDRAKVAALKRELNEKYGLLPNGKPADGGDGLMVVSDWRAGRSEWIRMGAGR